MKPTIHYNGNKAGETLCGTKLSRQKKDGTLKNMIMFNPKFITCKRCKAMLKKQGKI